MYRASSSLLLAVLLATACDKQPEAPAREQAAEQAQAQADAPKGPIPSDAVVDHEVKLLDGSEKSLADYRGKTLLVVNVASECGFTPQYGQLQELYATYKDKGLEVLAFPSNDFGEQEPGTPEEIQAFVDKNFSVEFEMFEKVATKGPDQAPLYTTLTQESGEGIKGEVEWNFTKFLVNSEGKIVQRFEPAVSPMDPQLVSAVEALL